MLYFWQEIRSQSNNDKTSTAGNTAGNLLPIKLSMACESDKKLVLDCFGG